MAQIDTSDKGGKKKKGAQKKMAIHVDFTPMVDMNMLLITFFMLCTTMLKSQTLSIILPSNDENIKKENKSQADVKKAITLILDTEYTADGKIAKDQKGNTTHNIYYYTGRADNPIDPMAVTQFKDNDANKNRQGIRKVLYDRHKKAMMAYEELKKDFQAKKITKQEFDEKAKEIATSEDADKYGDHPVVIVKPGPNTTYEALVYAIDELNLNQIRKYSIEMPTHEDTVLLKNFEKTSGKTIIRPNVRKAKK